MPAASGGRSGATEACLVVCVLPRRAGFESRLLRSTKPPVCDETHCDGSVAAPCAGAIPNKEGTPWTCEGDEVLIIEAGRNGWINGEHHQAVFTEFIETFTPEGGGEPDVEGEQQFYGNRGSVG